MIYALVLILILYLIFDFVIKNRKIHKNEPNGPIGLPIFGNLFMLGDSPHISLTNLTARYGKIYKMYFGGYKAMIVTDPEIIKDMWITQIDKFNDRPNLSNLTKYSNNKLGITFSSPEIWSIAKSLIGGAFTKTKLKLYHKTIEKQTNHLINTMNEYSNNCKPFQSKGYFSKLTMNVTCSIIFGEQVVLGENTKYEKEMKKLVISIENIYKFLGSGNLDIYLPIFKPFYFFKNRVYKKQIQELMGFIKTIYNDHLVDFNPDEPRDLMDQWINASQTKGIYSASDEKVIRDQIIQMGSDFLIAGTDTTSITLSWCLIYIINFPEIGKRLYNEIIEICGKHCKFITISYKDKLILLNNFFKEVMRIRSVGPLSVPRVAMENVFVKPGQHFIEKGTIIYQNIYGLSHIFVKDSQTFNPDRWGNYYKLKKEKQLFKTDTCGENSYDTYFNDLDSVVMPFSIGNRNCIGSGLSDLELFSVFSNIILNFEMESIDGKSIDDSMIFGLTTHPADFSILLKKRIN